MTDGEFLQQYAKCKWVVENVKPYYEPFVRQSFQFGRHLFWSNFQVTYFEPPKKDRFIKQEDPKELMNWLGLHYEGNLYYDGNHCPAQVLRNAVHPKLGQHVFECSKIKTELF